MRYLNVNFGGSLIKAQMNQQRKQKLTVRSRSRSPGNVYQPIRRTNLRSASSNKSKRLSERQPRVPSAKGTKKTKKAVQGPLAFRSQQEMRFKMMSSAIKEESRRNERSASAASSNSNVGQGASRGQLDMIPARLIHTYQRDPEAHKSRKTNADLPTDFVAPLDTTKSPISNTYQEKRDITPRHFQNKILEALQSVSSIKSGGQTQQSHNQKWSQILSMKNTQDRGGTTTGGRGFDGGAGFTGSSITNDLQELDFQSLHGFVAKSPNNVLSEGNQIVRAEHNSTRDAKMLIESSKRPSSLKKSREYFNNNEVPQDLDQAFYNVTDVPEQVRRQQTAAQNNQHYIMDTLGMDQTLLQNQNQQQIDLQGPQNVQPPRQSLYDRYSNTNQNGGSGNPTGRKNSFNLTFRPQQGQSTATLGFGGQKNQNAIQTNNLSQNNMNTKYQHVSSLASQQSDQKVVHFMPHDTVHQHHANNLQYNRQQELNEGSFQQLPKFQQSHKNLNELDAPIQVETGGGRIDQECNTETPRQQEETTRRRGNSSTPRHYQQMIINTHASYGPADFTSPPSRQSYTQNTNNYHMHQNSTEMNGGVIVGYDNQRANNYNRNMNKNDDNKDNPNSSELTNMMQSSSQNSQMADQLLQAQQIRNQIQMNQQRAAQINSAFSQLTTNQGLANQQNYHQYSGIQTLPSQDRAPSFDNFDGKLQHSLKKLFRHSTEKKRRSTSGNRLSQPTKTTSFGSNFKPPAEKITNYEVDQNKRGPNESFFRGLTEKQILQQVEEQINRYPKMIEIPRADKILAREKLDLFRKDQKINDLRGKLQAKCTSKIAESIDNKYLPRFKQDKSRQVNTLRGQKERLTATEQVQLIQKIGQKVAQPSTKVIEKSFPFKEIQKVSRNQLIKPDFAFSTEQVLRKESEQLRCLMSTGSTSRKDAALLRNQEISKVKQQLKEKREINKEIQGQKMWESVADVRSSASITDFYKSCQNAKTFTTTTMQLIR